MEAAWLCMPAVPSSRPAARLLTGLLRGAADKPFRNRGNEGRSAAFEFIDRFREVCFVEPPR